MGSPRKMHQFILYASVEDARHSQVLNILAGIAATQPTPFAEQHLLFAPPKPTANGDMPNAKRRPQQAAQTQRYWEDINRDLDYDTLSPRSEWMLLRKEEPEAGSPALISQPYTLVKSVDPQKYHDAVGVQIHVGHFLVHGNIVFKVFRVLVPSRDVQEPSTSMSIERRELTLFDASGAYLVEASVRIEDRSNSRLADIATKELLDVKKLLQGSIDLYAPDRLALDTRIRDV